MEDPPPTQVLSVTSKKKSVGLAEGQQAQKKKWQMVEQDQNKPWSNNSVIERS